MKQDKGNHCQFKQTDHYDLVIVGAGVVGVAAAFYAIKDYPKKKVCIIEKSDIQNQDRYWSSSFSAKQNRIQYTEKYLTEFVLESNKEWDLIQKEKEKEEDPDVKQSKVDVEKQEAKKLQKIVGVKKNEQRPFKYNEGALWFGDKKISTSEGNIFQSNAILTKINENSQKPVERLYMEKISRSQPTFMQGFDYKKKLNGKQDKKEWDAWSALYQPDGGSIDMKFTYKVFMECIKKKIMIFDKCEIIKYEGKQKNDGLSTLKVKFSDGEKQVKTKALFIAVGVETPSFLANIIKEGGDLLKEASIEQYVASYFKIRQEKDVEFFKSFPTFINFLPASNEDKPIPAQNEDKPIPAQNEDKPLPAQNKPKQVSAYGFPYHEWDDPIGKEGAQYLKIGTMANVKKMNQKNAETISNQNIEVERNDQRAKAAISYVQNRMHKLDSTDSKHYRFSIVFYEGRETILDYLNRKRQDIVVQTGGWVGNYFPLLAKTAIEMIFNPIKSNKRRTVQAKQQECENKKQQQRIGAQRKKTDDQCKKDPIGNFLNRTRFPIRKHVQSLLNPKAEQTNTNVKKMNLDVAIIGAGCAGLYAAWKLQKIQPKLKIGIFESSERISGRLKSVRFTDTTTPMELGGMRYLPEYHKLVQEVIKQLGIPTLEFPMSGNPLQTFSLNAYLRDEYYHLSEWSTKQKANQKLTTSYRLKGNIVGMNSSQITSYSLHLILMLDKNANIEFSPEVTDKKETQNKGGLATKVKVSSRAKQDEVNKLNYSLDVTLKEWNEIKPLLKIPVPYEESDNEVKKYSGKVLSKEDLEKEWSLGKEWEPLYKFGFQNIIEVQFGHEAFSFILDHNGYTSGASNNSYLEHFSPYIKRRNYLTLHGGYDMFNYNLANRLLDPKDPNKIQGIFLKHELTNLEKCNLEKCNNGQYKLQFKQKKDIEFFANRVVLAMPRRAVEILQAKIQFLQKNISNYHSSWQGDYLKEKQNLMLKDLLKSVQITPAVKIIINFSQNWWDPTIKFNKTYQEKYPNTTFINSVEQMRGVSVTDLPLRQALYFSQAKDNMILASYNDMVSTTYWEVYHNNFSATPFVCSENVQRPTMIDVQQNKDNKASRVMVLEVLRQLSLLHGMEVKKCWVKECLYQNWGVDPFGGGYHHWNPGYDVEAVMKCMRKPWSEQNIHIIGEAFSNTTGWVEGCLQTTEMFLRENYQKEISHPIKGNENYYLGW